MSVSLRLHPAEQRVRMTRLMSTPMYAPARRRPMIGLHVGGVLGRGAVPALTLALALGLLTGAAAGARHLVRAAARNRRRRDGAGAGHRQPVSGAGIRHGHGAAAAQRLPRRCEAAVPLQRAGDTPTALRLRMPGGRRRRGRRARAAGRSRCRSRSSCPPDKMAIYLKEISASPAVRAAWAEMQRARVAVEGALHETRAHRAGPAGRAEAAEPARAAQRHGDGRAARGARRPLLPATAAVPGAARWPAAGRLRGGAARRSPLGLWRAPMRKAA